MGVVIKQSIQNTIITYVGFGIGALNTLFLYPHFLGDSYYGLTQFLLGSANVLMPFLAFGVHNTLVRYFLTYQTEEEKDVFLSFMVWIPLLFALPVLLGLIFFYPSIAGYFSDKNPLIYDYFWQIPLIGLFMAYYQIFYAWAKIHLQSTFGNFLWEVFLRLCISLALFAVFKEWITTHDFFNFTIGIYFLMAVIMLVYAYRIRPMKLQFRIPANAKTVLGYSTFIILSGGIANVLLDLDKTMLGMYMDLKNVAYYGVAIFIATVISVPSKAMHQITYPITTKLMAEGHWEELNALYKKTSITLQVLGGLLFVGILVNLQQLFLILPSDYSAGLFTVFVIGLSKYFDLVLGNNNSIIFNSPYYKVVLGLGVLLAIVMVLLNLWLIPLYGINGSALATLISIFLYSLSKLLFVTGKMRLFPFTKNTIWSFLIMVFTFAVFYFWDFGMHPIFNIAFKSVLVTLVYVGIHYRLGISSDINNLIEKILQTVMPKKV